MGKLHEETLEKANGYVEDYNKALDEKDMEAKNQAEANVRAELKKYNQQVFDSVLFQLKQKENPLLEAVTQLTYTTKKLKTNRENGVETSVELIDAEARIDLVRVCEYCELPTVWRYKVEKLGLLLSMRHTKKLGGTPAELAALAKDYRMSELARKEEMGETPDSDTQVTKCIQSIMDAIFPNLPEVVLPDGKKKSRKANGYDANYMLMLSTRQDKKPCTVYLVDPKVTHRLFADVAHRIVTNGRYNTNFKKNKETQVVQVPAPETKPEAEKADDKAA